MTTPEEPRPDPDDAEVHGLDVDDEEAPQSAEEELVEVLNAEDRDRIPGVRPVIACLGDGSDPDYEEAVQEHALRSLDLVRRGSNLGRVVELQEDAEPALPSTCSRRWDEAEPFVLPRMLEASKVDGLDSRIALWEALRQPDALRTWIDSPDLGPTFEVLDRIPKLTDPARDLERLALRALQAKGAPSKELWVKTSRLSTYEDDGSLRVRFSFGTEGIDDASRDGVRHELVGRLAERVLPEASAIRKCPALADRIEGWLGGRARFTQHIAYWNTPQGGALFHHDAFAESSVGGQKGVVYTQLIGETFWIALPIRRLAFRVIEFVRWLTEGDLPHLIEDTLGGPAGLAPLQALASDPDRTVAELAKPGCGVLGVLVNQGPEFTGLLIDAGHGFWLGPGDAVVLPNHGYGKTAMHSVFCASPGPTYALSIAVREAQPATPEPVRMGKSARPQNGPHRGGGRRRRSRGGRRGG